MKKNILVAALIIGQFFPLLKAAAQAAAPVQFVELNYGVANEKEGIAEKPGAPAVNSSGVLQVFRIKSTTDSVALKLQANFGIEYLVKTRDTTNMVVAIEWIFPKTIKDNEGSKYKTIKYQTQVLTNTATSVSHSIDQPWEMVKGKWQVNIWMQEKILHTRTFVLY